MQFSPHLPDDAYRLRNWLDVDPVVRGVRSAIGARPAAELCGALPADRNPYGWNIVGYHHAEHGVGEAARRMHMAIEAVGLPAATIGVSAAGARHEHRLSRDPVQQLHHRDSVYCVNADETRRVVGLLEHPSHERGDARRIGLWFWELSTMPPAQAAGAALARRDLGHQRVHVRRGRTRGRSAGPTRAAAGRAALDTHPVAALAPRPSRRFHLLLLVRLQLGVRTQEPARQRFDAYTAAFGPHDGAHLVIKSINGHRDPLSLERVRWACAGRNDIHVVDGHWSSIEVQAFIELSDCFVSLHRSEGFGLNIAAAMAAGKPVVATGYSGNMTFMNDSCAYLVPHELVEVGHGNGPYPPDAVWAEPHGEAAAVLLRHVFDHPDEAAATGAAARRHVQRTNSLERAAEAMTPGLLPELVAAR